MGKPGSIGHVVTSILTQAWLAACATVDRAVFGGGPPTVDGLVFGNC